MRGILHWKEKKLRGRASVYFWTKAIFILKENLRSILIIRDNFKRIGEGKKLQEPYQGSVLKFTEWTRCKMLGSCPNTCQIRKEFEFWHIRFCKFGYSNAALWVDQTYPRLQWLSVAHLETHYTTVVSEDTLPARPVPMPRKFSGPDSWCFLTSAVQFCRGIFVHCVKMLWLVQ